MSFEPLAPMATPLSRTGHVVESLRKSILSGALRAGQPLVESELAASFGVSKTPVREALKTLAGLGLVTMMEYRGAVVRSVDYEMARAVFEVRCLLEPEAVRLAVGNGIDLTAAQHALERSEAAKDSAERSIANRDFHRLTYASCGNPLLLSMLDDLRDQTALISVTAWQNGITWVHEAHEHVAILEAAARGDAEEAKHLVDLHIRRFTEHALTLLEEHHA
ncbi:MULTISPECIES: GntR family transcriptional regulator [unclassified Pseudoclavibacter]|uniref:GntR family transcriptional regulator n=1 Tax=unclassified Pseudoclavibacter TaxID=2615177 RepID=UPI000CE8A424|nr:MULTISPECIES: GntR family transcriptional regulator [unclassified Pseudoclavibacter]MBS3180327.1 GntR family transcriptional regulator [Pseudoclavibacter sp. Marseille-Q4354]PPG33224.1 GntR family transcriptional regulator [Pseudoclavibacter sp. RFBB5]